jgi:hypothetical protein
MTRRGSNVKAKSVAAEGFTKARQKFFAEKIIFFFFRRAKTVSN